MIRFFLLFLLIQGILLTVELTRPVQQAVLIPFFEAIARLSVWLIERFDDRVHSYGVVIRNLDNGFAVSIQSGCNGVEASIVLLSAVLAFSAPWRQKLVGFLVGFGAVQAMNLLRIISLFYLGQWNRTTFEWGHLYIWQVLIMLDVLIAFLIWLRFLPRPAHTEGNAGAA